MFFIDTLHLVLPRDVMLRVINEAIRVWIYEFQNGTVSAADLERNLRTLERQRVFVLNRGMGE